MSELATEPRRAHHAVAAAVAAAREAQPAWASRSPRERARALGRLRREIAARRDDLAAAIEADAPHPRAETFGHELLPVLLSLRWHETAGPRALRSERPSPLLAAAFGMRSEIRWRPYGVVGAIAPRNYPFHLAMLPAIPALLAGNAVVVKPSERAPAVTERMAELFAAALPRGVAAAVGGGPEAGQALLEAGVDRLCFIGSAAVGRDVALAAAERGVPTVMELGGQDAAIVLEDAPLDVAASGIAWAAFVNAGQACCAVERVYVEEGVADRFEELLAGKVARLRAGRDLPPVPEAHLDAVRRLAADALARGARRLLGPDGDGWLPPYLLEGRTAGMAVFDTEIFGPLLPIVRVRDADEAVRRANEEGANLTVSIWTADRRRAESLADRIAAGSVSIGDHGVGQGAVWAAWGGVGRSGHGRLHGRLGVRGFTVPVHVTSSRTPRRKRFWWFPYDADTEGVFRHAVDLLGRPLGPGSARAAASALVHAVRASRRKL
ncbi:MAG: aldehyde dehydrogenase family protein [Candidatus Velamenicoccus archaeovorus]